MAKKRARKAPNWRKYPVKGSLSTVTKSLTTVSKNKIKVYQQYRRFPRALYIKRDYDKKEIEKYFAKKIRPEFERFYKAQRGKKRGNQFIFTIVTGLNFKSKRFKSGFSDVRRKIRTHAGFEFAMAALLNRATRGFLAKLEKYLGRRGIKSFSIRGVKMEVSRADKSRATKRSKRKGKKKIRRS